jgi:hypothetical protein
LPPLPAGRPLRHLSPQRSAQPARADSPRARLLPL